MTIIKRIIIAGFTGFYRNRTVSLSSILILAVTLSIIASLMMFRVVFDYTTASIKSKVDVGVYLKKDTDPDEIASTMSTIKSIPNVKSVILETREQALEKYKLSHQNDAVTLQALELLGSNPFGANISITATDPTYYEGIVNTIQSTFSVGQSSSTSPVEKVNYMELKESIDRLNEIISWVNKIGYWLTIIFVIMSAMIVYNTVRLAIFVFRDEINVMKLVGASNAYIRGPFIVESALYGLISTVLTVVLFYPITSWITQKTSVFLEGLSLSQYYTSNVFSIFFVLLIGSVIICGVSSFFAVRKYLKV